MTTVVRAGAFELSDDQLAAAGTAAGPLRVVAGAGTGKTAVIAARFVRLVEAGIAPAAILVMTFTERAAAEMRDRIMSAPSVDEAPWVGTFHSVAMRWLRDEGSRLGLNPTFRVLAGTERWISMRELMWELGDPALIGVERPDDLVSPLLKLLERTKQELVPLGRLSAWLSRVEDPERRSLLGAATRLFRAYGARCRRDGVLDFDDILVHAVRLLENHAEVRERLAGRFRWVLVDEYQDTNLAQERVVELIAGGSGNVCVVGDDDQSIYRFRGASRASMDRFLARFPAAVTVTLGLNRRSTRSIVQAACRLIEQNPERLTKSLGPGPDQGSGEPVQVWRCAGAAQEASAIAAEAVAAHAIGTPWPAIAVLARTHAVARPVAEALAASRVPFQHWAGRGLFRRPEVRDVIAYLRLLHDPNDLVALARLLARPPLSVDVASAFARLHEGEAPRPPLDVLARCQPTTSWAELMLELLPLKATSGVDELLFELLSRSRHLDGLLAVTEDELEAQRIAGNVSRFGDFVADYCERRRDHSLSLFVEYLDLVLSSGLDEEVADAECTEDAVQLMTIHQAKGLEFDLVFVPALVEGRLPQPRRRDGLWAVADLDLPQQLLEPGIRGREDQLAEERRLLYVAMTRARHRLVLSWAERYEGERAWRPSRFLAELGDGVGVSEGDLRGLAQAEESRGAPLPPPASGDGYAEAGAGPVLSFSAISVYRECPRQHWYRYMLRLPSTPGVEAQLGTILHLVLMRAGKLRSEGRDLTSALLRELHQESWEQIGLSEPRRRPALEALGWRLLERFLAAGGLDSRPHLVEAPFLVEQRGWTLRGVIDRVDRPAAGETTWRLIDYKTGSAVPASRLRRNLQLALYALGARESLGLDPVELEIVYLRDGRRVVVPAAPELLEEARQVGAEVAAGIRAGHSEARPERRRCTLCSYRLACESAL